MNYKQLQYGKLLTEYNSFKNSNGGHNANSAVALVTSPLIVPAAAIDIILFFFGAEMPLTEAITADWWGGIGNKKDEIKRRKRELLNSYNNLK